MATSYINRVGKFITPYIDEGFKRLFGREESKDILLFFLNNLFGGDPEIVEIQFMNNEQFHGEFAGRKIIHDLYCTTSEGEHIIVEMQNERHANFANRCLYYMSAGVTRQGQRGNRWKWDIKGVYGVFFTNFVIRENGDQLISNYIVRNEESGEPFPIKWRMHFINLPNMTLGKDECKTDLEKFIYVFKNMGTMDAIPYTKEKKVWKLIEDVATLNAMSQPERDAYEEQLHHYWDAELREEYVLAKGIEQGRRQGIEQGRQQGMQQGIEKGIEKGRQQEIKAMVKSMAANGIDTATIARISNISVDEVNAILKS